MIVCLPGTCHVTSQQQHSTAMFCRLLRMPRSLHNVFFAHSANPILQAPRAWRPATWAAQPSTAMQASGAQRAAWVSGMVAACYGMLWNAGMDKQGQKHTTCLLSTTQRTRQVASWLCLLCCSRPAEALVRSAARGESLQRWRATTHLIIDEASLRSDGL